MTKQDVPQRFPSGEVEVVYSNSKFVSVAMQIMFILLGGYFFWVMLHEHSLWAKADNVLILAFCLWRIDRQGDPLCYVCKKGIVVQRQFMSIPEFFESLIHRDRYFVFLPYKDIFEVSNDWREIQLGKAEDGGIAVLPVRLQFLSPKHKQALLDRIKEHREAEE